LRALIISAVVALSTGGAWAGDTVRFFTDFDGPDEPALDPRQADARLFGFGVERFGPGDPTSFLAMSADKDLDRQEHEDPPADKICQSSVAIASSSEAELGPALDVPDITDRRVNCPQTVLAANGKPFFQRNEFRLTQTYVHPVSQGHWYGLRFRTDGAIATCGSIRQVLAQWKFRYQPECHFDDSPILSLRIDNGVLVAAVQTGHCRCTVAKSRGDPEWTVDDKTLHMLEAKAPRLRRFTPVCQCPDGVERPPEFTVETLEAGPAALLEGLNAGLPELPDPREDWVEVHAFIRAEPRKDNRPDSGRIELYANGKPVVRVSDGLGYPELLVETVRFKFGAYRDAVPAKTRFLYDRLCIDDDPERCGPPRTIDAILKESMVVPVLQ
jgi:hypothetical protein